MVVDFEDMTRHTNYPIVKSVYAQVHFPIVSRVCQGSLNELSPMANSCFSTGWISQRTVAARALTSQIGHEFLLELLSLCSRQLPSYELPDTCEHIPRGKSNFTPWVIKQRTLNPESFTKMFLFFLGVLTRIDR